MIRREIVSAAAVAAAFFVAGQFAANSPSPVVEAPKPLVEPAPPLPPTIEPAAELPQPLRAGEVPNAPLMLDWPEDQPVSPTLTWPPSGCDAGMWSMTYEAEVRDQDRIAYTYTMHDGKPGRFEVSHLPGWKYALYPVSPQSIWFIDVHDETSALVIQRIDHDGARQCGAAEVLGASGPGEVRAIVDDSGIRVFRHTDRDWSVFQYDNSCALVDSRTVPGNLFDPMGSLDTDARAAVPMFSTRVEGSIFTIEPPEHPPIALRANGPVLGSAIGRGLNASAVAYWDEHETHITVFGLDWEPTWTLMLQNQQPWQSPITGLEFTDRYVSIRGGLDASPWNAGNEWVRVYDMRTGEVVGSRERRLPLEFRRCRYTGAGCFQIDMAAKRHSERQAASE